MKVVVTGGAGFVGSHLVDALVAAGHEVHVVDHHKREKVRYPNAQATVHKFDFRSPEVEEIIRDVRPDAVYHLAAQISVVRSIVDPYRDAYCNIIDSLHFLDVCRQVGVKKFIFASSGGAIYGDHPVRPTPLLEDAHPNTPYGVGKQMFEFYLAQMHRQHGMPFVALRFANIYGPRQQASRAGEEGNVISIFLSRLLSGDPIVIYGDGMATRDYLFVQDAVRAFVAALDASYVGPVNVSTGNETTVRMLYDALMRIHGGAHPLVHEPYRHGETFRSALDFGSARQHLRWEPATALDAGLEATYRWYMSTFR